MMPKVGNLGRDSHYGLTLCANLCCWKLTAETPAGLNLDRDAVEGETVGRTEARVLDVKTRCIFFVKGEITSQWTDEPRLGQE